MKNALLIAIIVLNGFYLSGQQLHIAQDIQHCAFGLKNDSGKWVVKPVYLQIKASSEEEDLGWGWIVSFDGMHFGLLDAAGQIAFAPVYKNISYYKAVPEKKHSRATAKILRDSRQQLTDCRIPADLGDK